jgi:hypothetical protein
MSLPIRCRRALALAGAALLALPFVVVGAVPADAQTTVTTEQQLRDAVTANAATIVLGANLTLTCDGVGNGPLAIDSNTTLRSSSSTEMRTLTVNGTCRIIEVTGGATLTVERLHLTGGRAPSGANGPTPGDPGTDGGHGGAILSDGTVTITDSRLSNNRAGNGGHGDEGTSAAGAIGGPGGAGGAGGSGGAIYTTGAVTVTRSTLDDNRAGIGGDGGAGGLGGNGTPAEVGEAGNDGFAGGDGGIGGNGGDGGAIAASGTVTIARSTLTANLAGAGGAGGNGGAGGAGSAADVGAGGNGGAAGDGTGGGNAGSGGAVSAGSINVTTSTLHANTLGGPGDGGTEGARGPGGAGDDPGENDGDLGTEGNPGDDGLHGTGGATSSTGNASFVSATVTANTATDEAAARSINVTSGSLSLNHTYVGGTGDGDDCVAQSFGAVTASMAGDATCTGATLQANPDLAALASNGGPTQTRLPNAASPLVNAGAATCPETTDQRGVTRKQGTLCDIGAVELRGALTATVVGVASAATAPVGDDVTVTFTVTIASTATGVLGQDELAPTITGCTTTPVRSGSPAPYVANDVITWTCTVTSATVTSLNVTYAATVATGEGSTLPLNATVPVQFQQAITTTTADPTTTTTTAVVVGDGGVSGAGGGALPRTGLSVLFTLVAGAALVFGGSSMSKVAKARVDKSPRWNVKYGVPYPAGTHKQRTRDDQI